MDKNYIYNTPGLLHEFLRQAQGDFTHAEMEHPYTIKAENFLDMFTIRRIAERLNLVLSAEVDTDYPMSDGQVFHVQISGAIPNLMAYIKQVAWAGIAPATNRETSRERRVL